MISQFSKKSPKLMQSLSLVSCRAMSASSPSGFKHFELKDRHKELLTQEFLQERAVELDRDGFTIIHDLYDSETIDAVRDEMDSIISEAESTGLDENAVFTTKKQIEHLSKSVDYFLDSGSKISFFYEKDAFDKDGNLVGPLNSVLNKVGHAMHDLNTAFHQFCYSNLVKSLVCNVLGFINPCLVQTMYIFKSAKVGGEVNPHQDNTYIIFNPLSCKAIWVALDDATKENGCMWGIPGSHKTTPIDYYMKAKRTEIKHQDGSFSNDESSVFYEPENPPEYTIENKVPLEMKKGSIV